MVARWILVICPRFENNLITMWPVAEFTIPKLNICTNLQKKYGGGVQNVLVIMELLSNAHNGSEMDFANMSQIWKKSDENVAGSRIYRTKIEPLHQFTENAQRWSAEYFGDYDAP